MRSVLLFDIDGTIVTRTSRIASSKQLAYTAAIEEIYGIPGLNYMDYQIFGLTDRGILYHLLQQNGLTRPDIAGLEPAFRKRLLDIHRDKATGREQQFEALPGAVFLLDWLIEHAVIPGLATGNFEELARFKLEEAGLEAYFSFGGYGEDGVARTDIVKAAIKKSPTSDLESIGLLGDTPNDLTAAREAGISGFAVATGMFSRDELQYVSGIEASVFENLLDTQTVGRRLTGLIT